MDQPNQITISPDQRRAALEALGLDPDLTVAASVSADYFSATVMTTNEDGHVIADGGSPVTHTISGPIQRPDPA